MAQNESSFERKLVAYCFVFIFTVTLGTALLMEKHLQVTKFGQDTFSFDSSVPVKYNSLSETASSSGLKAVVKGSIYENGSNMTVFGACFDGNSYLLPEANATFTAWYPNGTIMVGPNASMFAIYDDFEGYHANGTGRWGIHVTMGDTIGTYLTEMRCELNAEWAIALGEWQNPEWVRRIGQTQDTVNSLSVNVTNNLSQIINQLNSLNTTVNTNLSVENPTLENALADYNRNTWIFDPKNPFYVLGSGTHNWEAVDMQGASMVAAASSDGYIGIWDGETWAEYNQSAVQFRGVSALPSSTVFVWAVGTDGVSPVISINGANYTVPANVTGTALNDIKLFPSPNNPASAYYIYVLSDDGSVWLSTDFGTTYTLQTTLQPSNKGRFSQVVENWNTYAVPSGYVLMIGQNESVTVYNGSYSQNFTISGCTVNAVSMLQGDLGYVAVKCGSDAQIYKYDGASLSLDYTISDPIITPTGVEVLTPNNVWVTTQDPSVFYHFDGRVWEYSTVGWTDAVSVVISFGNISNLTGIKDLSMSDTRHGYAVGSDGAILIFKPESNSNDILEFLQDMNASISYNLDNVLSNVTYTQLYLNTTLYPLINATYQNTLQILIDLGIIQAQLNQSIQLQNDTLQIVNATDQKVDELLNRSNRIRAWVTQ